MANILSSQKKNRQRITHEARNRAQRSEMRTAIKKLRAAIVAKNATEARGLLGPTLRLLDRAGGKGLIKVRNSSRTVSRLSVAVNALGK